MERGDAAEIAAVSTLPPAALDFYGTAAMRAEFGRVAQLFAAILTVFHGKFLLVRFSLRNGLAGQSVGKIRKTKAIV